MLMDSRTIHRGTANHSCGATATDRLLLYCSFQIPKNAPPGSTYTMLDEYRGRFKLSGYEKWADPHGRENELGEM